MHRKKAFAFLAIITLCFSFIANVSTVFAETYVPKDPGNIHQDLTGDYGLLGIAGQFHVFAKNKTTVNAHTDGNIATHELDANDNFGTNLHEGLLNKEINYIQRTDSFINSSGVPTGDKRVNKFVVGTAVAVSVEDGHPTVNGSRLDHLTLDDFYQDQPGNAYIQFEEEFAKLNTAADTLMNLTPIRTYTAADFPDMNNRTIDLTGASTTGFALVNIQADVLSMNTPLTIINPDDQIVVFNVVNSPTDFAVQSQIKYNNRTNHETEDFSDANISWNFGNAISNLTINAPFQGTILAPNATIDVRQSQDGTLIGTNILLNAATNRWDPNEIFVTPNEDTVSISGEKTWDDDNDSAGARPTTITVALLQNGTVYRTQPVTADQNGRWLYTFTDLPKYDLQGNEYIYTVSEANVPENYSVQIDGYNLTNVYEGDNNSSTTDTGSSSTSGSTTDSTDTGSSSTSSSTTDSTDTESSSTSSSTTDSTDTGSSSTPDSSTDSTDTGSSSTSSSTTDSTDTGSSSTSSSTTDSTDTGSSSTSSSTTDSTGTESSSIPAVTTDSTSTAGEPINSNQRISSQEQQVTLNCSNNKNQKDTKENYLLQTGSTSNKWFIILGLVLIAVVIADFVWKRRNEH